MVTGTLIAESLRVGAELDSVPLRVKRIWRADVGSPPAGQPNVWTLLYFEADDDRAELLGESLAAALDEGPWYVDFTTADETFVVFAGKVFSYPRGDEAGRSAAAGHAASIGIPEDQLDWAP
ncbi:hypothetical protein [Glycomyces sp. NPDC048151]|uniref:hypothetical protein n=1 Tax=Glycomyces sp. NPDC048151 TaxID=3364002 RepID=UPI00371A9F76